MPSEYLTLAVSSGLGVGIFAGIVSGVCYVLVHGFVGKRARNSNSLWHCVVCNIRYRSIEGVLEIERVVTCTKCGARVCRLKCSIPDHQTGWICRICHQQPETWFKGILKALQPNSSKEHRTSKSNMDLKAIDETDEDLEAAKQKEKEQVRDFMETLVETMLGSSIDSTSVGRLYNDRQYDNVISRYHIDLSSALTDLGSALHMSIANLPILGQSPCSAHANLKLLIQRVIQEAIGLPTITRAEEHPGAPAAELNRSYEDLLATAIINKVIETYQDNQPTSSRNSTISSRVSNSSHKTDKEYFFGEETLDSKWKNENTAIADVDTTSISSVEEWVRSDSSVGSTKYINHMSLTIQQRIDEATSSSDEERDIEPVPTTSQDAANKEWQENWVMQRRKFGGTASPVPVPMLVPHPSNEAKVLIGDRDAEDTSDLSDAGTDFGEMESLQGIESILVDSRTVIGGKNVWVNVNINEGGAVEDHSTDVSEDNDREERRSLESSASIPQNSDSLVMSESSIIDNTDIEDTRFISLESQIEQDTEYTEKFATLPRTIFKSPTQASSRNLESITASFSQETAAEGSLKPNEVAKPCTSPEQNGYHSKSSIGSDEEEMCKNEKFAGSYSEREKRKWRNAVEMKNNPYSSENLNRRLGNRSSSNASLFGREYYIKEAAQAAGTRKKLSTTESEMVDQEDTVETLTSNKTIVFKAVPVLIDTETESSIEVPLNTFDLSTSDSDLSIERVYNLNSGKVYEKIGDTHREIIEGSRSPEGIKYKTINTEFNFDDVDENHNSTVADKKWNNFNKFRAETEKRLSSDYNSSTADCVFSEPSKASLCFGGTGKSSSVSSDNDTLTSKKEFSLEYSSDDYDTASYSEGNSSVLADPEIVDLKDKHLVREKLGLFSKSYQDLTANPSSITPHALEKSVHILRKRFNRTQEIKKTEQVHSLTARSIPRELRDDLKLQENGLDQRHENSSVIKSEEEIEEVDIFPVAKSRIQFFENLAR